MQRHQIGEHRHRSQVDAGRDHHDLLADHPDRHVDSIGRQKRLGPYAGCDDDSARADLGAVGQLHPGDGITVGEQTGYRGALADSHAGRAGGDGERLGGLVGVAVAAAGFPAERGERGQVSRRPQAGYLGGVDLLGLDTDGALGGHAFAQGVDVGFTDADDVSGLSEADVVAENLFGLLEHLQPDGRHGGQRAHPVVAAHNPAGLAGHSRGHGITLCDNHIGDTALAQRPGGRASLDSAADDDDISGLGHRPAPGIQEVPASGTRAIAAASIVTATRSSGSRCSR